MKGKKLVIAVILALIVCLVLIPTCAFAETGENVEQTEQAEQNSEKSTEGQNNNPTETGEGTPANKGGDNPGAISGGDEELGKKPNSSGVLIEDEKSKDEKPEVEESDVVKEETEEQPAPATGDAAPVESSAPLEKGDYTLTLKNGDKHSVVAGDSTTSVSQIFKELEVSGKIESIEGSNSDLFTFEKDGVTGEWVLVSKQPFTTEEFVMVKLAGQDEPIIIKVTDPEEVLVDLNNGNVTVDNTGTETGKTIVIKYYDDGKTLVTKNVENGSTIHVKQTNSDTTTANKIDITLNKAGSNVTVILDKLNISGSGNPITARAESDDSKVMFEIVGKNVVKTTDGTAIRTKGEGTFVIQSTDGTGKLVAESQGTGATIGGAGNDTVGNIEIRHVTVTATKTACWSNSGAAIGGGGYGYVKSIVISHATVTAELPEGVRNTGAAIGSGAYANVGSIVIEDSAKVTATNGYYGAAIGSGQYSDVGSIVIKNSTVNATAKRGAAIGAGFTGSVGTISIEDSDVTAQCEDDSNFCGAAIGAGAAGGGGTNSGYKGGREYDVGAISISNSKVIAKSATSAIGGGSNSRARMNQFKLTISGNSEIDATGDVGNIYTYFNCAAIGYSNTANYSSTYVEPDTTGFVGIKVVVEKDNTHFYTVPAPTPTPAPVVVPEQTTATKKDDTLVEAKKDNATEQSNVSVEGTTAKITVTDNKGEVIAPQEVTIKSVTALESTGATEASIQLDTKLVLDLDVATIKSASTSDVVTVTNEDSVITVKSGETALVSVDVKAVVSETEQTVTVKFSENTVKVVCGDTAYSIDLSELGDVGTLTLKLENGVLKVYDKDGKLLKEIEKA